MWLLLDSGVEGVALSLAVIRCHNQYLSQFLIHKKTQMLKKCGMVTSERPFKCMEFEEFALISETFSCVSRLV